MANLKKFWLLATALTTIVVGFLALAAGRLSIGPILLVAGYCVLLPLFLWQSYRKNVGE